MKPILFNTDMVRACLDGRKTVTRRVVKPPPQGQLVPERPGGCWPGYFAEVGTPRVVRPPYRPGDILYVRETWTTLLGSYIYRANQKPGMKNPGKWRPSVHMPREAARIFLRVTGVRVERLRDITPEQCVAEGIQSKRPGWLRIDFADLWNSTIKPRDFDLYSWDASPWVWVIGFERISKEEAERLEKGGVVVK